MKRTVFAAFLVPLLLVACKESPAPAPSGGAQPQARGAPSPAAAASFSPDVKMPKGFEAATLGRAYKDVRAELPQARLVKQGGDVYLQEKGEPPHFRSAQIWFHSGGTEAPPEDSLTVQRAIFATAPEEDIVPLAGEVAGASDAQNADRRKANTDMFDRIKASIEDDYGKATLCVPDGLSCEWNEKGYQVRLYTVDALDSKEAPQPVSVVYVIRAMTAPDAPKREPIKAAPSAKPAAPGVYTGPVLTKPPEPTKPSSPKPFPQQQPPAAQGQR